MTDSRVSQNLSGSLPAHIAIIMDGNGRWAAKQGKPRFVGHRQGLKTLERLVGHCIESGIKYLTAFAFSTENWQRPAYEVDFLMKLFSSSLDKKVGQLRDNNIQFRCIGRSERLSKEVLAKIDAGQRLTIKNTGLILTIAVDYGGRWDMINAANQLIKTGQKELTEENISPYLALSDLPEPELFIRTGGELRLSNFLLWQMAYTEFYFTDILWPDFDKTQLLLALDSYRQRERRFGSLSGYLNTEKKD